MISKSSGGDGDSRVKAVPARYGVAMSGQGRVTARMVADELRAQISDGTYGPGDQLPSRSRLMERFHCSGWTVVNAINILRTEDLVVGLPGAGWFVRSAHPVLRMTRARLSRAERADGRGTFLSDAEAGGWVASCEVSIDIRPAPPDLAEALHLNAGEELLVRDRLMFADAEPIQLATSWLPRELTRGTPIEERDTGDGGIYARLEEAGHQLDHFDEVVRVGVAAEDEASRLQLNLGASVYRITRIAHTQERPVEVNRMVAATARYELHYSIPAE